MDLSVIAFLGLLVVVALLRIVELQISRRHQKEMIARGAAKVDEPRFRWMVLLHTAVLIGAALEVVLLRRPFIPILAAVMFTIFLAANVVRWWVIRTLGNHWNVQVMDSTSLGVISSGPFRYVRHPNYAAVFAEMLSLPLIHTAWITAVVGSLAHIARALHATFHGRARSSGQSRVSSHHGAQTEIHSRCFLRRVSRPFCRIPTLAVFVLLAPGVSQAQKPSDGSDSAFTEVPELKEGFRLLYVQKYPEAREKFSGWTSAHPEDPFGFVATAASYLFEEFYRQSVLTSDFFLDDKKFLRGIEGKPDPERVKHFDMELAQARKLADARLSKDKNDAAGLFALTMAAGMESNADSILEKKHIDGLKRMKEANEHAKLLLAQRPDANDAWVAPGSADYIIGCLSGGTRMVLWFGGIHGDKKLGMELVGKTAEKGRYLEPFAKVLLALAARREKQDALALKLLHELTEEFPDSPLFAAEYAKVQGRPIPAEMKPN